MKPKYRMMKLTCVVEVNCQDGKWVAKSDSLNMTAEGGTPDAAVEALKRNLQTAEDAVRRGQQAEKVYGANKKREESPKAEDKDAEQVVSDKDTEPADGAGASSEEDLRSEVESASVKRLREIAEELGVLSDGMSKVPLREKLIAVLDGAAEEEEDDEFI